MKITRVGVDLAKSVFQVHGVDRSGGAVWRRQLRRSNWLRAVMEKLEPGCVIGMEACSGAHHWGRTLRSRGFEVKLITWLTLYSGDMVYTCSGAKGLGPGSMRPSS